MVARPSHPIDMCELQRRLAIAAKGNREHRFHALYDRIWRSDVLLEAWKRVRSTTGAAGIGGETLARIEQQAWGHSCGNCNPRSVRESIDRGRCGDGAYQPSRQAATVGHPTVRDRVVQMAAKIVLEPILEADFQPCSHGFVPASVGNHFESRTGRGH